MVARALLSHILASPGASRTQRQCRAPEHSDRFSAWTRHRKTMHGHHTELFKELAQSQQDKAAYDFLGLQESV